MRLILLVVALLGLCGCEGPLAIAGNVTVVPMVVGNCHVICIKELDVCHVMNVQECSDKGLVKYLNCIEPKDQELPECRS